jgi:hypothetical protein
MDQENQTVTERCGEIMLIDAQNELGAPPAPESYVYILYSAGLLKIGTTIDPQARVEGLRSSSSSPVSLIWLTHGDATDERELHKRFARDRFKGEWFRPSDDLRAFIAERPAPSEGYQAPGERLAWAEANPDKNLGPP